MCASSDPEQRWPAETCKSDVTGKENCAAAETIWKHLAHKVDFAGLLNCPAHMCMGLDLSKLLSENAVTGKPAGKALTRHLGFSV